MGVGRTREAEVEGVGGTRKAEAEGWESARWRKRMAVGLRRLETREWRGAARRGCKMKGVSTL